MVMHAKCFLPTANKKNLKKNNKKKNTDKTWVITNDKHMRRLNKESVGEAGVGLLKTKHKEKQKSKVIKLQKNNNNKL